MSADTAPNAAPELAPDTEVAPARGAWRRRPPKPSPIPGDQAARQGAISTLAFLLLGRAEAIAFLNTVHDRLGGRPLALATASAAGAAVVEAELARMTGAPEQSNSLIG